MRTSVTIVLGLTVFALSGCCKFPRCDENAAPGSRRACVEDSLRVVFDASTTEAQRFDIVAPYEPLLFVPEDDPSFMPPEPGAALYFLQFDGNRFGVREVACALLHSDGVLDIEAVVLGDTVE